MKRISQGSIEMTKKDGSSDTTMFLGQITTTNNFSIYHHERANARYNDAHNMYRNKRVKINNTYRNHDTS